MVHCVHNVQYVDKFEYETLIVQYVFHSSEKAC